MRSLQTLLKALLVLNIALFLPAVAANELRLATTTSLENSGLLAYLLPEFEQQCTCHVRVIPVGTGKALALGKRGDVDVLLVHAPAAEQQFIADGYGSARQPIAYNYFILLAPPTDPAAAAASGNILNALKNISEQQLLFLSRGDDSGTHKKELALWQRLAQQQTRPINYDRNWYIEAGVGMGQAIIIAEELGAYVISDTGTYLHLRDKVTLQPLELPPSDLLYNPYSVIRINPQRHPHVNSALAKQFSDWLATPQTRQRIANYRLFGESLFTPIEN